MCVVPRPAVLAQSREARGGHYGWLTMGGRWVYRCRTIDDDLGRYRLRLMEILAFQRLVGEVCAGGGSRIDH